VGVAVDRGAVLARAPLAFEAGEERAEFDERLHELERRVLRSALRRWGWERHA
jgi:folate-dependent phosphoribosylglycinamide formyltransferase PurN